MISAVCSIAAASRDDDLQVGPAVGAEQRARAAAAAVRAIAQRPVEPRAAPARARPRPSRGRRRPWRACERSRPAANEKSRPCCRRRAPSGCRARPAPRPATPAARRSRTRPVRGRIGPGLAGAEVAVEPPAAALEVGERRDRVGEQRQPRPPRPKRSGRRGHADRRRRSATLPRAPGAIGTRERERHRGAARPRACPRPRRPRCRSRTGRRPRAAAGTPLPQSRIQTRVSGVAPGVGDRERLAPCPAAARRRSPRSVDVVGGRGRVGLARARGAARSRAGAAPRARTAARDHSTHQDDERARPVHALDALELDVRGRARAGDEA